jgi:DNA helicase-2/ATP-dependent DNA helicase PcrA
MMNNNKAFYAQQFEALYKKLNTAQKQAVDTIEGPVLVVAGPGTGKTQVLSARIANILHKTDVVPQNILALTFTESAAKNMKERVISLIGKSGYGVEITTFHSFCASVISEYPEYFSIGRDAQAITDVELFETIKAVINELPLEVLKPLNAPYFYLKDIVRSISQLKREGVTPENFEELVTDLYSEDKKPEKKVAAATFMKVGAKNKELAQVYKLYQQKLLEKLRYDFDDMIAFVIEAFEKEESLLLDYQEKYQYFLVDEYQDTNTAQNKVVQLLASHWEEQANIFVVGDPHQSIYRFQGASTENVLNFTDQYPEAKVITLDVSYRCPQELVDVAHDVISNNTLTQSLTTQTAAGKVLAQALTAELQSVGKNTSAVQIWSAASQTTEIIQVAQSIKKLLSQGVPAEEVAVLYRTNKEVTEISEVFEKWGVPYETDGGTNVFDFEPVRQLLQLFTVVESFKVGQEDERFFEVICYEWFNHNNLAIYKLVHLAGRERTLISDILALEYEQLVTTYAGSVSESEYQQLQAFIEKLKHWAQLESTVTFVEWFDTVVSESGFLEWVKKQPTVVEHLLYLNTLRQYVEQLCRERKNLKLPQFLAVIETMLSYGISLIVQDLNITQGAVHLSTVHKAKGREWQYVYILHCIDGLWGNTRERNLLPLPVEILSHTVIEKKEKNEDDRRLLYVALTRAKKQVVVSFPETIITTATKSVNPSMFISEIQESRNTVEITKDTVTAEQQAEFLSKLVSIPATTEVAEDTKEFFESVIQNYKLSISGLNNYLQDPGQFILRDLLRIPSGTAPYLAFGTAVHAALEELFKLIQQGKTIDSEKILKRYEEVLSKEILTREDFERRLEHGKSVLRQYIDELAVETVQPWKLELRFGTAPHVTVFDDIQLVGRIDRLDWIDKTARTFRVIDYKTGSAKTRNTIEGKTQSAGLSERESALPESIRSPFKRQLLFYKLLTELHPTYKAKVLQGVFEFVVPDSQTGKTTTHTFDLPDADVEELKSLIKQVMKELRSLEFLQYLPAAIATVGVQSK